LPTKPKAKANARAKKNTPEENLKKANARAALAQEKAALAAAKKATLAQEKEAKAQAKALEKAMKKPSKKKPTSFSFIPSSFPFLPDTEKHIKFAFFCKMQEQFPPREFNVNQFLIDPQYEYIDQLIRALYELAHRSRPLSKEMNTYLERNLKFYNKPRMIHNENEMSSFMKFGLWASRQIVEPNVDSIIRLFRLNKSSVEIDEFVLNPVNDDLQSVRSVYSAPFSPSNYSSSSDDNDSDDEIPAIKIGGSRWVEEYTLPRSLSMQVQVGTPHYANDDDMFGDDDVLDQSATNALDQSATNALDQSATNALDQSATNALDQSATNALDHEVFYEDVVDNDVLDNAFIQEEDHEVFYEDVVDNDVLDNAFIQEEVNEDVVDNDVLDQAFIQEEVNEVLVNDVVVNDILGKRKPDFHGLRIYQETVSQLSNMDDAAHHLAAFNQNVANLFNNHLDEVEPYMTNVSSFVEQTKKRARFTTR
jgi:hypothetical protein